MIQLMHGDCLNLMKEIEPKSVDLVLADPPYGITNRNKWDKVLDFDKMWEGIHHVSRKNTPILMFSQLPFGSDIIQSNRKEYRYEWVWNKISPLGFLNANRMPLRLHENILVFYKKLPRYNPQFWTAKTKGYRGGTNRLTHNYGKFIQLPSQPGDYSRYPVDIIEFSNADKTKCLHPTQKPVALLEYLIKTYTNEGDTVLDFCMGSGSTGIACLNTGRNFIGIELDDNYFEIAKNRIGARYGENQKN